jgi:hypothetical protein
MKRFPLLIGMVAGCLLTWAPQVASAHHGWRWGYGSYYGGSYCRSYYYPRYYSSPYCGNYGSYYGNYGSPYYGGYGSNYGYGYAPYANYGSYSPYGTAGFGSGGANLLGLLAMGNLGGSVMQPSYLSMPVSVGFGPPGFLQIPLGNTAGRPSYLQVPVNAGYGPSSYLQIELGRSATNAVPNAPAPGATQTAPPFGAVPGVNAAAVDRLAYELLTASSQDVPTAVATPEYGVASAPLVASAKAIAGASSAAAERSTSGVANKSSIFHLVSWSKSQRPAQRAGTDVLKDTSFSLVDSDVDANQLADSDQEGSAIDEMSMVAGGEITPWVVK